MTNQRRATDDSLDRTIDDVARQMTALEPAAELRARIMSRIDERPERTPRRWAIRVLPLAVGVAAVVTMAIALRTPRSSGAPVAPAAPERVAGPVDSGPAAEAVSEPAATLELKRDRTTVTRVAVVPQPSDDELAWLERSVPALPQPEALTVEGIQPETLTIAHIELKPLVPGPLAPGPPDGGGVRR